MSAATGIRRKPREVGWQNYPAKYHDQNSRLFIFWTADYYQNTGCYNLECPAFVQVSSTMPIGADFSVYSTPGGKQYEFSAEFQLYQGNWWLSIQGTWIGYYPGTLYQGGQLSKYAQQIQFGTESVGSSGIWPGEGSGNWSDKGFGQAAYQRNLFYINTQGKGIWASLTPYTPSPNCYTISGPFTSNSTGWNVYFFEGGPGGSGCSN
jgi:hypothetical protein